MLTIIPCTSHATAARIPLPSSSSTSNNSLSYWFNRLEWRSQSARLIYDPFDWLGAFETNRITWPFQKRFIAIPTATAMVI